MNDLVFLEPNKIDSEPFTTSKVIADMTGIEHRKIKVAIRKHQADINSFGLSASYQAESSGGRPEEIIRLNEPQATFLMTLLKNTPIVVAFKKELVRQFYAMRNELLRRQVERTTLKPIRREMTDAIQEYDNGKWSYKKYTDLVYKSALGKTAVQLRKERGAPKTAKAMDYLTADELAAITKGTYQVSVLLEKTQDYELVKALMLSKTAPALQTNVPQ